MALQYDNLLRNNQVAQIQATIGSSGSIKFFSGAQPANCGAADPAGLLATIPLPAVFLTSINGVTNIAGTWSANASANGTAASWRMYDGSSVCRMQGNVTTDLVMSNPVIVSGQPVSVASFTVTVGNA